MFDDIPPEDHPMCRCYIEAKGLRLYLACCQFEKLFYRRLCYGALQGTEGKCLDANPLDNMEIIIANSKVEDFRRN